MAQPQQRPTMYGNPHSSFWLHSPTDDSYDLTHQTTPTSPPIQPRLSLKTTTSRVTVDPSKTALVIVDMQNFFLSPALGWPSDSKGLKACDQLLRRAIPAARRAGIRIVWLNWGLTEADIETMPPAILKAFTFPNPSASVSSEDDGNESGGDVEVGLGDKTLSLYLGLGSELGPIKLADGATVEGGRVLMREQWNAQLYRPLDEAWQHGTNEDLEKQDVWIHKNRMSGTWGGETDCTRFLEKEGIKTLLFAGVNTDQCVVGTLQDAFAKGYDCLLLSDGCATTSPSHSQECVEFNTAQTMGFVLGCKDLEDGAAEMSRSQKGIS